MGTTNMTSSAKTVKSNSKPIIGTSTQPSLQFQKLKKRLEITRSCTKKICTKCMLGAPPPVDCAFKLEILMNEEEIKCVK
jgi:hypothetical protein